MPKKRYKNGETVKNLDQFLTLNLDQFFNFKNPQILDQFFNFTAYISLSLFHSLAHPLEVWGEE